MNTGIFLPSLDFASLAVCLSLLDWLSSLTVPALFPLPLGMVAATHCG